MKVCFFTVSLYDIIEFIILLCYLFFIIENTMTDVGNDKNEVTIGINERKNTKPKVIEGISVSSGESSSSSEKNASVNEGRFY